MSATRTPATVSSVAHCFVNALSDGLRVDGPDGHHIARVLRARVGETVTAADNAGAWRAYDVAVTDGDVVDLVATTPVVTVDAPTPALAVAFGITKGAKPETAIAHLTELGVDRIVPVLMAHSVVRWDDAKRDAALARFRTTAREAAMQSRRVRIPIVEPVADFRSLLAHPALIVGHPDGDAIADLAPRLAEPTGGEWCAVVGPEGGFSPDEHLALLSATPYPPLAVGRNVLRAETAALAVAAVLASTR